MSKQTMLASRSDTSNKGSMRAYVIGFVLSVLFTMIPYLLVQQHASSNHEAFSHELLTGAVIVFALVQLAVQLKFFIHLSNEPKPYWNKLAFFFMLLVVFIIVGGSLWIMDNLHYNMMSPQETDSYMQTHENIL